jgi:hypothetical protein
MAGLSSTWLSRSGLQWGGDANEGIAVVSNEDLRHQEFHPNYPTDPFCHHWFVFCLVHVNTLTEA